MYSKYSRAVGENKSFILANSVIITDFSDYDWPSNVILNKKSNSIHSGGEMRSAEKSNSIHSCGEMSSAEKSNSIHSCGEMRSAEKSNSIHSCGEMSSAEKSNIIHSGGEMSSAEKSNSIHSGGEMRSAEKSNSIHSGGAMRSAEKSNRSFCRWGDVLFVLFPYLIRNQFYGVVDWYMYILTVSETPWIRKLQELWKIVSFVIYWFGFDIYVCVWMYIYLRPFILTLPPPG